VDWGLARISSRELTELSVLMKIEAEEDRHARDIASSPDGIVHVHGREGPPEDEGDDGELCSESDGAL
jgi:hypothetical protein